MLKTAIIGVTGYGKEHLRLLLHGYSKGLMKPEAAVVVNPNEAADQVEQLVAAGCPIFDSVEDMWAGTNGSIDLCMIPSPIGTHYPFARMALENGAHVFVEKPVCGTIQEVNELVSMAESRNLQLVVGYQNLYSEKIHRLKRRILDGDIGKLTLLKGWGSWPRPQSYYQRNDWAGRLKVGDAWVLDSPVNNAMAHFLAILLYLGGASEDSLLEPVSLEGELYRIQNIESFDTASFRLLGGPGKPDLYYAVSHSGDHAGGPFLRIEGESGWIEWNHCGTIRVQSPKGTETEPCLSLDQVREFMIESVCRRVRGESTKVVTARDVAVHTRIVNALHDAGPIIELPEEQVARRYREQDTFRFLPGLADDLEAGFTGEALLSECHPSRYPGITSRLSLEGYEAYAGGFPADTVHAS